MQCPDEDRVKIAGFPLVGSARKWWAYGRTRRRHTWAQFKTAFHIEFCPRTFVETKRLKFETLTQGSMTVSEYERRLRELSDFCPNLVEDEVSKKRRFLDGLSELIALSFSGSDHPTYQSMRDAALEVERQTTMDCLRGAPVRDHLRGVVSTLDLRAEEDPVGTNVVPTVAGFREVDIHRVLNFD